MNKSKSGKTLAQLIYDSFPVSLNCERPGDNESLCDYRKRVVGLGGDTLFEFLLLELDEEETSEEIHFLLLSAISDIEAVMQEIEDDWQP